MTIEAHHLQTWIGKIEDVYFCRGERVALSIRSGVVGRRHHVAPLRGASVSRDSVQLNATAETLIATDGDDLSSSATRHARW